MKKYILVILVACLYSCKSSINADDLYGKWKYIKVEQPYADPPDSTRHVVIVANTPSIQFSKNNTLTMVWGGNVLSHGKFNVDGRNIRYTESLADGTTRTFPFWVSELTDKEIIFETKGVDGSRVTAVKQ